jgi:hypothetical protein
MRSKKTRKNTNTKKDLMHRSETTKKMIRMLSNLRKFKVFYKKLSKEQKAVLAYYKSFGYVAMNQYLYNNKSIKELNIDNLFIQKLKDYYSENTKSLIDLKSINPGNIKQIVELYINKQVIEKINSMDDLFKLPDIPKLEGNEYLYRGTNDHTETTKKSKVGDIITYNNYLSTSTLKDISEEFVGSWRQNKKSNNLCCMYILHNLKDIPFIYIPWQIKKAHIFEKTDISQVSSDEFEYLLPRGLKFKIIKIESKIYHGYGSTKKLSFSKLDKIITLTSSKYNSIKLNDNSVQKIFDKTNKKITTYHLEYVGQEPVEKLPLFEYNAKINLHITPETKEDITSSKQKIFSW